MTFPRGSRQGAVACHSRVRHAAHAVQEEDTPEGQQAGRSSLQFTPEPPQGADANESARSGYSVMSSVPGGLPPLSASPR